MKLIYNDTKKLRIRKDPNGGAKVIGTIEPGMEMQVEKVERGWCKLAEGWCMADFVTVVDGDAEAACSPVPDEPEAEPAETENAPESVDDGDTLQSMTVAELRKLAKDSGIDVKPRANKAELIAAIIEG